MKKILIIIICISLQNCNPNTKNAKIVENTKDNIVNLKVYGVQINVTDFDKAIEFYSKKIGFQIKSITKNRIALQNEGINLFLYKVVKQRKTNFKNETRTSLVLHTNNLDSILVNFKNKKIPLVKQKTENGVGFSAMFSDPFGNVISVMEQSKYPVPKFKEPKIYNVGYAMNDLKKAKQFYCNKLGFHVKTNKYFPALPLAHQDSTFAFMLHKKEVKSVNLDISQTQTLIIFSTKNSKSTIQKLENKGVVLKELNNSKTNYLIDPFGNLSKLIENE